MNRLIATTLCASLLSAPSFAQPPGGGRGQGRGFGGATGANFIQLLEMKEVQEDLKLTDAEKGKIGPLKEELTKGDREFRESLQGVDPQEMREKFTARRAEVEKQVKEAIGDKYTRFTQIRLQLDGLFGAVMQDRTVAEKLEITDDQRGQLREAMQAFPRPNRGDPPPTPEKAAEMQKARDEAVEKVLTAEQKKKWEELIGAKVTYKRPPPAPPGDRPGRKKEEEKKPPV
jgi:hypothetical protein